MRTSIFKIIAFAGIISFGSCSGNSDPSSWDSRKIDKWFEQGDWLNGWTVKPDPSVNRKAFAVSYFRNKERWDKAFTFLKSNDLKSIEVKRHDIDGDNLYAPVSEYITKSPENAMYESHRKYIDIQYVISGKELIGIAPASKLKEVLTPYDALKDVELMTVEEGVTHNADPGRFFIFFPEDLHCPGLMDGENSPVRKVVVKVKID
jgi:YhcH/YjgK/YiaL family protein